MALTLRPTTEQLELLQLIQTKLGESTHSKAIFSCCEQYLRLVPEHDKLKTDHLMLQAKYQNLLRASKNYFQAQTELSEIINASD